MALLLECGGFVLDALVFDPSGITAGSVYGSRPRLGQADVGFGCYAQRVPSSKVSGNLGLKYSGKRWDGCGVVAVAS